MTSKETDGRVATLRAAGHRITKVRRAVLQIFETISEPPSAEELIGALKRRKLDVNKTTVYRELDFLLAQHLIREIDLLEGKKRYELIDGSHHHHLVCLQCRTIRCIEMDNDLDAVERDLLKRVGFEVKSHSLEFFGVCADCRGPQRTTRRAQCC